MVFMVLRHDDTPLLPGGLRVLEALEPWLMWKTESSEWPGTVLQGHTATVWRYHLTVETAAIIKNAVSGLYDWLQPDLPEDLRLLRADGSP